MHDYVNLLRALVYVPEITKVLTHQPQESLLSIICSKIHDFSQLSNLLTQAINDDFSKEWVVKPGFNSELDRLRLLLEQGTQAIIGLERKEQEATGINSLKIRYNGAHGYGIEITKANMHLVPPHYIRTQTLVNRERFTTQEFKDLEYDLNRARTDIFEVEKEIFDEIKQNVESYVNALKKLAYSLSYLDALTGFAHVAYTNGYSRPIFSRRSSDKY